MVELDGLRSVGTERRGEERARLRGEAPSALGVASVVLILLFVAPLMLALMAAVALEGGGPIFYAQQRVGRNGRRFQCLKLRTMSADAEARLSVLLACDEGARREWEARRKLTDDPRVTRVGAFLRRSSFDELPQLLNVLRGDMALVGPRPIVAEEIARYGRSWRCYCAVKPGITGLWQVSGRSGVDFRRRVALDRLYVARRSVRLDVLILLRTIPAVMFARGAR